MQIPLSTASFKKHLTNLAEWKKLGEANIFPPESRLELINGEIIEMAPIGSNHSGHLNHLIHVLTQITRSQAITTVQNPVQLGGLSEPQTDLMLLKPNTDFYSSQHPSANDVLLLIEVSESSLAYDQNQKLRLYMRYIIFLNIGYLMSMMIALKYTANLMMEFMLKRLHFVRAIKLLYLN